MAAATGPDHVRPIHLVLLGGPGVGKGTQAELLAAHLNAQHFSTGALFRDLGKDPAQMSPLIAEAMRMIAGGNLVPDEIVIALVRERLHGMDAARGVLFDGFPRTLPQAQALDQMLEERGVKLDAVLNYELRREQLIQRLSGRRVCSACGESFHVVNRPPKRNGVCDLCGAGLMQRVDDRSNAILVRLEVYEAQTRPLIDFYSEAGRLVSVSAEPGPDVVLQKTLMALGL